MYFICMFPQIVRADLKELVDLDLGGAPYGYTPFCDSRKEMEGFRYVATIKHNLWVIPLNNCNLTLLFF